MFKVTEDDRRHLQGPGKTLPPDWVNNLDLPEDCLVLGIVDGFVPQGRTGMTLVVDTGEIIVLMNHPDLGELYDCFFYPGRVNVLERGKASKYKTIEEVLNAVNAETKAFMQRADDQGRRAEGGA